VRIGKNPPLHPEGVKELNRALSPGLVNAYQAFTPRPTVGARELSLFFSFPSPPFGGEGPGEGLGVRGSGMCSTANFFTPALPSGQ
jgi:hypothetical protein